MFSPSEQQIEICLLKSNLEEIENDLIVQRSALPALDAENEQKYRETMAALRVARSLNMEMERLKLENVQLTAKRMQMKRQCEDINRTLDTARERRRGLTDSLIQEEHAAELLIRQYEDSLLEKADRFRKTRGYYNETEMDIELEKVNNMIFELEGELERRQDFVKELREQLEATQPQVPDELLVTIGRNELYGEIKELTEKYEALLKKRNELNFPKIKK